MSKLKQISYGPSTALYGIIGYPLGHTLSPLMHNTAFMETGIDAVYLAFPMKNIINLKYSMRQFGVHGLSVTIPHKINIKRSVEKIDPMAVQIGSVNTVMWDKKGLLYGCNTDGDGALDAIVKNGFDVKGKKVLIIGSGGSARAIAFAVSVAGPSKITILSRNAASSRSIIRGLRSQRKHPELTGLRFPISNKGKKILYPYEKELKSPSQIEEFDLVIQTTPMGMAGSGLEQVSPLGKDFLFKHQVVFDIVYNPQVTPLVAIAQKKCNGIIPGYQMLLYQGVKQFELFTGVKAPVKVMDSVLQKALNSNKKRV